MLAKRMLEVVEGEFQEKHVQAFKRVKVNGQAPKHVAADLGVSIHVVYNAIVRITKKLREEFHDLGEDGVFGAADSS